LPNARCGEFMTRLGHDLAATTDGVSSRVGPLPGVQWARESERVRTKVRFRHARESDAVDLACLIDCASRGLALWLWSTLRKPGQATIEVGRHRIRTQTASPLHFKAFTIAEIEGVLAGAMTGRLIPIPHERGDSADLPDVYAPLLELEGVAAGSWYLNVVAVYPEFRGKGVGAALLRQAEQIACLTEATQMSLIVEDANSGALKLYLRYGFSEWARRPYIPFPGSADEGDWMLLRKEIAK
jgi:ribosomal protein S18 acetylase RimI-like enzyme